MFKWREVSLPDGTSRLCFFSSCCGWSAPCAGGGLPLGSPVSPGSPRLGPFSGAVPLASAGIPVPFRWPIGVDLHDFTFGLYISFSLPFLVSFPRAEGFIREITPYTGSCGRCGLIFMVCHCSSWFFFLPGPSFGWRFGLGQFLAGWRWECLAV